MHSKENARRYNGHVLLKRGEATLSWGFSGTYCRDAVDCIATTAGRQAGGRRVGSDELERNR